MNPPRLVYDDVCGFCTWCARFAARHGDVELVGFSALTPDQRARLPDEFETCVHLLTDTAVYSCGEGVERTLEHDFPTLRHVFRVLRTIPGYETVRETSYRWGADRRDWWGRLLHESPPAK